MRVLFHTAFVLSLVSYSSLCGAVRLRVMPSEERISKSTLIVIGRVVGTDEIVSDNLKARFATVRIIDKLKGKSDEEIQVEYDGPIAETRPLCCVVGSTYIFFLQKPEGYIYLPVNGKYGVRKLEQVD